MKRVIPITIFSLLSVFLRFPFSVSAQTPATMNDFWNNNAQFVLHSTFRTPTEEIGPNAWNAMNVNNSIVVKNGVWYLFNREYYSFKPSYCASDTNRVTVRKSVDKGKTWTNKTRIIEPVEGSANECGSTDGDAYYDAPANTWHYFYQCLKRSTPWALCHATYVGAEPLGQFVQDLGNPVVGSRELWGFIKDNTNEEGTPEIIKKIDNYYYVTFHGADTQNLYRGIAKTKDFNSWEQAYPDPIFEPGDCNSWNIQWNPGGCHGGGHATIIEEGGYYYQFIEAPDMFKGVLNDTRQNWVFGLSRTTNLTANNWNHQWENLPLGPIIIDNNMEKLPNGSNYHYAVGYQKFFRDTDGTIYMAIWRGSVVPNLDEDRMTNHYIYKLERNAPFLDYEFKEGPGHFYPWSSIVSRTPSFAQLSNTTWTSPTLAGTQVYFVDLNNANAYIQFPDTAQYQDKNALDMQIDANIRAKPSSGSSFIYGIPSSLYIELYPDGNLCGWVMGNNNTQTNVCTNIDSYLNQFHQYQVSFLSNTLTLKIDGRTIGTKNFAVTLRPKTQPVRIGSATQYTFPGGIGQSFNGVVARARMSHSALPTYSYIPGDLNRNKDFDAGEMKAFFQKYNTNYIEGDMDFNQKINAFDFRTIRANY